MKVGFRDAIARHFPVPVEPAPQRANVAVLNTIIFGEHLVRFAQAVDRLTVQLKVFKQVFDQHFPGKQAHGHRDAGFDKKNRVPPPDGRCQNVSAIRHPIHDDRQRPPISAAFVSLRPLGLDAKRLPIP